MKSNSGKFIFLILMPLILFPAVFLSCPNDMSNALDLKEQIQLEVAIATARTLSVTIEASPYGIINPSGTISVKEGIPFTISAVPFSTHELAGWKKLEGTGIVLFSDPSTSTIQAAVTGSDVTIGPLLEERPKILYSTPIGNSIAKNTTVSIIFSRQVNFDSINSSVIQILRSGNDPIAGTIIPLSDGKTIKFEPAAALSDFTNYVISVSPEIKATINPADPEYADDTTLTNLELYMPTAYTAAFRTGNALDVEPPVNGQFTVTDISGDLFYTRGNVLLTDIAADDDAGIAFFLVRNPEDPEYQTYDINSQPISWTVPSGDDGEREIYMLFEDVNGMRVDEANKTVRSIYIDRTPPSGTISINSSPGAPGFTGSATVSLALSAVDADVQSGPQVKGSGESTDGSNTVNRKEMRFSNSSNFKLAVWEPYAVSRTGWELLPTGDGSRMVYVQYRDGAGNISTPVGAAIYLDTTAPAGSFTVNGGGLVSSTSSTSISLSYADGSGSGIDKLKIEPSPGLQGNTAWRSYDSANPGVTLASGTLTNVADPASSDSFTAGDSLDFFLKSGTDGDRIIAVRFYDKAGNSSYYTRTLKLDTTPPSGGSFTINNGAPATNNINVTIQVTAYASDAISGTSHMGFSHSASVAPAAWLAVASTANWTLENIQGTRTVYLWFRDAVGNHPATANASRAITLDTSPPSGSATISPNPTASATVTITGNFSNANDMRFSNNNSSWIPWEAYNSTKSWSLTNTTYGGSTANGTRYVYCQYRTLAGTVSSITLSTVYDNTPPTATMYVNSNAAYTNSGAVTLNISASDNIYSAASLQMRFSSNNSSWSPWEAYTTAKSWSLTNTTYGGSTANGTRWVYMQIKDPLNNTRNVSDSIVYDTVAPAIGVPRINSNAAYTNSATCTISFTTAPSDATSGIGQIRYSNNNSTWSAWETYVSSKSWNITSSVYGGTTSEGTKYVYVQVRDNAGNISPTGSDAIVYDITSPTGHFFIESGNPATTSYSEAYLYFYITDNLSGVTQRRMYNTFWSPWEPYTSTRINPPWFLTPGNGVKTVYAQFRDGAGNTSTAVYDQVTLAETYASLSRIDIAYDRANLGGDSSAYMNITSSLAMNDTFAYTGAIFVYCTNAGRYGKLEIVSFNKTEGSNYNVLTINMTTFNADGSVYASKSNLKIRGTYSCDLDLGVEGGSGPDFWWSITNSTTRSFVPQNGARFFRWK